MTKFSRVLNGNLPVEVVKITVRHFANVALILLVGGYLIRDGTSAIFPTNVRDGFFSDFSKASLELMRMITYLVHLDPIRLGRHCLDSGPADLGLDILGCSLLGNYWLMVLMVFLII